MTTTWKQDFFTQLAQKARSENCFIYNPNKAILQNTPRLEVGESSLSHTGWSLTDARIRLTFYTAKSKYEALQEAAENKRRFLLLKEFKGQIERDFGEALLWDYDEDRRDQYVDSLAIAKATETNRPDWPRIQADMLARTKRMGATLKPYLQHLDTPSLLKRFSLGGSAANASNMASVKPDGGSLVTPQKAPCDTLSDAKDQPLPEEYRVSDALIKALPEGAKKTIVVNAYERNPKARAMCLAHYGTNCTVCGFSFAQVYGECGAGYIHVHHIKPISEIGGSYNVDPVADLRPVCPNCHAMLHATIRVLSIDELKALLKRSR